LFRRPPNISSGEGINLYNLGREHGAVLVLVMPTARAISDRTRLCALEILGPR